MLDVTSEKLGQMVAGAGFRGRLPWSGGRWRPDLSANQVIDKSLILCAVPRHGLPAGVRPARQLSLQPVAIGAVVEVTKRLKPSVQRVALGDWRAGRPNVSER